MSLLSTFDSLHHNLRSNTWMARFTVLVRIALAAGFIPSGMQKVLGERFTVLAVEHPMGHYLDAVFQTGFYYPFIGAMQVLAALLLLIPRTATLGVLIYFPIVLNIAVLSLAVRFDGSLITSPLMALACVYLMAWDYHKFKFLLAGKRLPEKSVLPEKAAMSNRFPVKWFVLIVALGAAVVLHTQLYELKPRNTISECNGDCANTNNPQACLEFCACVHQQGKPLKECLENYEHSQ